MKRNREEEEENQRICEQRKIQIHMWAQRARILRYTHTDIVHTLCVRKKKQHSLKRENDCNNKCLGE